MLRITGGKLRGRQIASPRGRDAQGRDKVRPTTAMMRESIFNRLQPWLVGARFLDLFAGSGIISVEAFSRGADFVMAVDREPGQCRVIRQQLEGLGIQEAQIKIVQADSVRLMGQENRQKPFDIVFMDPPYGFKHWSGLLGNLADNGWLSPGAVLMAEHGHGETEELESLGFESRNYGETVISIKFPSASE